MKSGRLRISILVVVDIVIIFLSNFISHYLVDISYFREAILSSIVTSFFYLYLASMKHIYKKIYEYTDLKELVSISVIVIIASLFNLIVQNLFYGIAFVHILVISFMIQLICIGMARVTWRILNEKIKEDKSFGMNPMENTLIIGAGDTGRVLVKSLIKDPHNRFKIVGFIDNDLRKRGREIYDIPILGTVQTLENKVREKRIKCIIIAIPYISREELDIILIKCNKMHIKPKIIPHLEEISLKDLTTKQLREVTADDLLGRKPVKLDEESMSKKLKGKVILITGAGGSIGSELCRQAIKYHPKKLILLGHGENSIYNIEMELLEKFSESKTTIISEIADIQDRTRIFYLVGKHKPDIIYHTAAHKHVPLMEKHPGEAIKNNVLGTKNVAEAAHTYQSETMIMVSTDKAVNPTNIMGASKRLAEMIINSINDYSETQFAIVRFGNVLGSRGSVIPRFKNQISKGGPVTVTHPEMVRYFMTIPEASCLVIQASCFTQGGEIFVLDMGSPVKILDLAQKLIRLSGFSIEEIGIEFSGIRPGEKLYEELMMNEEITDNTHHEKIFIGSSTKQNYSELCKKINNISLGDAQKIRIDLKEIVPTYKVEVL